MMETQSIRIDLFAFANSEQSQSLGDRATNLDGMRAVFNQFATVAAQNAFPLLGQPPRHNATMRPEVSASLDRSLKDYATIWAELAKH
jgi:hypothetical protein